MTHHNNDVAITPEHPDVIAQAEATGSNPASIATALRLTRARHEMQALKEWQRTRQGPEPAIPNLNSIREGITMKTTKTKTSKTSAPHVDIRFMRNGTPMPDSANKLCYLAVRYTKNVVAGRDHISTDELVALLASKHDVKDPATTSWAADLGNGFVVGAQVKGEPMPKLLQTVPTKATKAPSTKAVAKAVNKGLNTPKAKAVISKAAAKNVSKATKKAATVTSIGKQTAAAKALGQRRATTAAKKLAVAK